MGAPTYYPPAIGDFDGTNDYLSRGSDLTGNADSKTGIFSAWLRIDGGDGSTLSLVNSTANGIAIQRHIAGNLFRFYAENSGGTKILDLKSTTAFTCV